jgi:hypothetical protein
VLSHKNVSNSRSQVAHSCDPRYSGGRDQEGQGSKSAWTNSSQDPILKKNPSQKKPGGMAGCRP